MFVETENFPSLSRRTKTGGGNERRETENFPSLHEGFQPFNGFVKDFVDGINQNISKIYYILAGSVLLLLLLIIILVNNTIKLAMFSQRFLIRSMQLVGATSILFPVLKILF